MDFWSDENLIIQNLWKEIFLGNYPEMEFAFEAGFAPLPSGGTTSGIAGIDNRPACSTGSDAAIDTVIFHYLRHGTFSVHP